MIVLALVLLALVLAWPAPRLLPRISALRRLPRAGLVLWQAVALAAVISALAAGPMALAGTGFAGSHAAARRVVLAVGLALTALMLLRLLASGHRVGTRLRATRRTHRELVDLLGTTTTELAAPVRLLEHPTPTAYCVPGLRQRVVLTRGTIDTLPSDELDAVLAHERAHLRARHDLILEFFTVVHTAVPERLRSTAGLAEVHLLVEVLADHAAVRGHGSGPLARALVTLARGAHPGATLGAAGVSTRTRLELLAGPPASRLSSAAVCLLAAGVLAAPCALILLGLSGGAR